jgi:accessory colonization factor AcfC
LIDVDSKIPNLALMKLSAYYKAKGDNVTLIHGSQIDFTDKPDKVYASIVFKANKHSLEHIISAYPDIDIDIGGSGYDLHKELPPDSGL